MAVRLLKADPDWVALHQIADGFEPRVRRAFLNALTQLGDQVGLGELTAALEARDITRIMRTLQVKLPANLTRDIEQALRDVSLGAAEHVAAGFSMDFRLVNEQAALWASEHAGKLITQVSEDTVAAVRDIVADGIRMGRAPRSQARLIRSVVGLTERDTLAVARRLEGLLESSTLEFAHRQADRYARKLLNARALLIARTEVMTASNFGQQLLWERAHTDGLLSGVRRVWIDTDDTRTCPRCQALDGKTVGLDGPFTEGADTAPKAGPVTVLVPPLHAACRCSVGLVEFELPEPVIPPAGKLTADEYALLEPMDRFNYDEIQRRRTEIAQTKRGRDLLSVTDKWENSTTTGRWRNQMQQHLDGTLQGNAADQFDVFLDAMNNSQIAAPDSLYRGMGIKGKLDNVLAQYKAGDTLDLNLSSFSGKRPIATKYAEDIAYRRANHTKVIVEWVGEKKALPLRSLTGGATRNDAARLFKQDEWVGAGRFRILDAQRSAGGIKITIQQEATLG